MSAMPQNLERDNWAALWDCPIIHLPRFHPHRPDLETITSADNHRKLKEDGLADLEAAATTGAGHSTLIDGLVHGPHPE